MFLVPCHSQSFTYLFYVFRSEQSAAKAGSAGSSVVNEWADLSRLAITRVWPARNVDSKRDSVWCVEDEAWWGWQAAGAGETEDCRPAVGTRQVSGTVIELNKINFFICKLLNLKLGLAVFVWMVVIFMIWKLELTEDNINLFCLLNMIWHFCDCFGCKNSALQVYFTILT